MAHFAVHLVQVLLRPPLDSPGGHYHSTLSLTVIGCRSLGIYTLILLSLLSFFGRNDSINRGYRRTGSTRCTRSASSAPTAANRATLTAGAPSHCLALPCIFTQWFSL